MEAAAEAASATLSAVLAPLGAVVDVAGNAVYAAGASVDSLLVVHMVVRNVIVLILLLAYDKVVARRLSTKNRWFSIHAFANLLVVLTALNSVKHTVLDPLNSLDHRIYGDGTMFGNASKYVCRAKRARAARWRRRRRRMGGGRRLR